MAVTPVLAPFLALLALGRPAAPSSGDGAEPAPLAAAAEPGAPALLVHGGRIHLNDPRRSVVEALLVRDGRVVAAGSLAQITQRPGSEAWARLDLLGGTAVPGLQDAHGDLAAYGTALDMLDLAGCADAGELVARAAAHAARLPPDAWVLGRGWDPLAWPDPSWPTHAALSAAVPGRPAFLLSQDGHAALVNQTALALAELDGRLDVLPRLKGGVIVRDDERRATGILIDAAMDLVARKIPPARREDRVRRLLAAQRALLALGLTCVHDMGVSPETVEVLRELRDSGELRLRVVAYLAGNDRMSTEMLRGLPERDEADRLSILGVSLVVDGALASRGAALLEDYADAPGNQGHTLLSKEDIAQRVALITGAELQPAVQTVGDRATRMVLDVYEVLGSFHDGFRRLRPRIEHAQVVAPRDWPRFPALGIVPSVQPVRAVSDEAWLVERLGSERTQSADAWCRLAPELGRLAFGSGFPAASPDPRLGLLAARTRHQGSSLPEDGLLPYGELEGAAALAGFTSGAAFACHQEDSRGRLSPGYAADLTVLDVDPVTCDPERLRGAVVRMTVIDGNVVYRAGP